MSNNFSKALSAYERQDTVQIQCTDTWFVEIRPFSDAIKKLTKTQATLRSKGVLSVKKQVASPSMALVNPSTSGIEEENTYMLGSKEADVKFFVDNILVGWQGLRDDEGMYIEFSPEVAMCIFLENGKPGEQLYRELLSSSLDTGLFIKPLEKQVEEDAKN